MGEIFPVVKLGVHYCVADTESQVTPEGKGETYIVPL